MVVHVTLAGFLSTKAGKAWFRAVCPRAVDGAFHQFHSSFRPKASRGAVPKRICRLVWPQGEAVDMVQAEQKKSRFHSFMVQAFGKPPKKGGESIKHVERQDVTNIKVMSRGAVPKKSEFENVPQIVLEIHWLSHRLFWSVTWWDMISWKMKDEINGAGLTFIGKPLTITDHRASLCLMVYLTLHFWVMTHDESWTSPGWDMDIRDIRWVHILIIPLLWMRTFRNGLKAGDPGPWNKASEWSGVST